MFSTVAKMTAAEVAQGAPVEKPLIDWHDTLFQCGTDCGVCCLFTCCSPCGVSNLTGRIELDTPGFDCLRCLFCAGSTYYSGPAYCMNVAAGTRREVIQRYNIKDETVCESCCIGLFCTGCSLCQTARMMKAQHQDIGGLCSCGCCKVTEVPHANEPMGEAAAKVFMDVLAPSLKVGFSTGLCSCACTECLDGFFCLPCGYGYIASRLDSQRVTGKEHLKAEPGIDLGGCCAGFWGAPFFGFQTRRELMERYQLKGETYFHTMMLSLFCAPCIMMQARRELSLEDKSWPGGVCVSDDPNRQ